MSRCPICLNYIGQCGITRPCTPPKDGDDEVVGLPYMLDPPFGENGIASVLLRAAESYIDGADLADGYVLCTEGDDHEPTDFERLLMGDMLNGLFSYAPFWEPLQALIAAAADTQRQRAQIASLKAEKEGLFEQTVRLHDLTDEFLTRAEAAEARLSAVQPLPGEAWMEAAARIIDPAAFERWAKFAGQGEFNGSAAWTAECSAALAKAAQIAALPRDDQAVEGMRWQPIETAPRKGTFLLAAHHGSAGYRVVAARRIGSGVHGIEEGCCVGWRPGHQHPAYWMPLPAPPEPVEGEG